MDESLLASNEAVTKAIVETAIVLAINVALGGEAPDLAAEPGGELGGVEAVYRSDPALAGEELVVVGVDLVAEYRDEAGSGDDNALLGVLLALGSGDRGGGGAAEEGDLLGGGGAGTGEVRAPPAVAEPVERGDSESRSLNCLHCGFRERKKGDDVNDEVGERV